MPETPMDLKSLRTAVAAMTDEMVKISHKLDGLDAKVNKTNEIVEAYAAVKVGGKFIKWLGSIATALAALWVLLKVGISHYLPGAPK